MCPLLVERKRCVSVCVCVCICVCATIIQCTGRSHRRRLYVALLEHKAMELYTLKHLQSIKGKLNYGTARHRDTTKERPALRGVRSGTGPPPSPIAGRSPMMAVEFCLGNFESLYKTPHAPNNDVWLQKGKHDCKLGWLPIDV